MAGQGRMGWSLKLALLLLPVSTIASELLQDQGTASPAGLPQADKPSSQQHWFLTGQIKSEWQKCLTGPAHQLRCSDDPCRHDTSPCRKQRGLVCLASLCTTKAASSKGQADLRPCSAVYVDEGTGEEVDLCMNDGSARELNHKEPAPSGFQTLQRLLSKIPSFLRPSSNHPPSPQVQQALKFAAVRHSSSEIHELNQHDAADVLAPHIRSLLSTTSQSDQPKGGECRPSLSLQIPMKRATEVITVSPYPSEGLRLQEFNWIHPELGNVSLLDTVIQAYCPCAQQSAPNPSPVKCPEPSPASPVHAADVAWADLAHKPTSQKPLCKRLQFWKDEEVSKCSGYEGNVTAMITDMVFDGLANASSTVFSFRVSAAPLNTCLMELILNVPPALLKSNTTLDDMIGMIEHFTGQNIEQRDISSQGCEIAPVPTAPSTGFYCLKRQYRKSASAARCHSYAAAVSDSISSRLLNNTVGATDLFSFKVLQPDCLMQLTLKVPKSSPYAKLSPAVYEELVYGLIGPQNSVQVTAQTPDFVSSTAGCEFYP